MPVFTSCLRRKADEPEMPMRCNSDAGSQATRENSGLARWHVCLPVYQRYTTNCGTGAPQTMNRLFDRPSENPKSVTLGLPDVFLGRIARDSFPAFKLYTATC
jgi:hypothetical protein